MKRWGVLFFFLGSSCAFAQVYPWVSVHPDHLRVIENPQVEAAVRLELICQARKSVDIVILEQGIDEAVGMPLLKAIKEVAQRGVKVRLLISWIGYMHTDLFNQADHFLKDSPLPLPIQFKIVGGYSFWKRGWGALDGVHEKLLIIDGKVTLVTGRGHTDHYLSWLDTAFLLKGGLVDQSILAYQKLWNTIEDEESAQFKYWPFNEKKISSSVADSVTEPFFFGPLNRFPLLVLNSNEAKEKEDLLHWVGLPTTVIDDGNRGKVYSGRLLHHDLIHQLRTAANRDQKPPLFYSWAWRVKNLTDPIIEELIDLVRTGKDLHFFALATQLNPKFKEAILEGLKNGLHATLMTNGSDAHAKEALRIAVGWYLSLEDLDSLLQAGAAVHALMLKGGAYPLFLHRKVAIVDDTVIFGSHNFNITSTVESDEMSFEIKGQPFADQMRQMFDRDVRAFAERLLPEKIHEEVSQTWFKRWLFAYFSGLYSSDRDARGFSLNRQDG